MKCFKCRKDFDNINTFLSHIRITHRIKGEMKCTCTLCFNVFGNLTKYKRHLNSCSKNGMETDMNLYDATIGCGINDNFEAFNESLSKNALHLMLKTCARPNLPRDTAFDIMKDVTKFFKTTTDGIITVINAEIEDKQKLLEDLLLTIESAFDPINTESKLVTVLHEMDLIDSFQRIDVKLNKLIDGDIFDEDTADTINDDDAVELQIEKPKCTLVVMPIEHQIQKFFELPNVFEKIQAHTATIMAQPMLNHFIKGSVWQDKIKNYREGEVVIPYNFYVDGVQLNNVLGPHTALGLENFNYISFPTVPPNFGAQLKNIMVTSLFQEKTMKDNGTTAVYGHVIKKLTDLAYNGIVLNINNKDIKVFFVMGVFEGDNKECNRSLDYPDTHSANHYCRFCRMNKEEMSSETEEKIEFRRTVANYDEDVHTDNMTLTGVKQWSVFNTVPYFHVVDGTVSDLPHDLLEGVLAYCFKGALKHLIFNEGFFTVDELNKRIKHFNFGDYGNKPPSISELSLRNAKKKKIKMNAAEMFNFCQNITFLIGEFIPTEEVNHVWEFVKNLVRLLDVCFLPWYLPYDLTHLQYIIKVVNEQYPQLFEKLKPVFHYLIHYPTNTKKYGPLRYVQTIRKEGKHRELKMYTKNSNSRLNISVSVAIKVQYQNALRAFTCEGLEDTLATNQLSKCSIKDKPYFRNIRASANKDAISARECHTTSKVVINGMAFRTELWLPDFTDKNNPKIYEIGEIIVMDTKEINSIYGICKVYVKISYEEHFVAHSVETGSISSHLEVINFADYLLQHQYPVATHSINGKVMFRCKRF